MVAQVVLRVPMYNFGAPAALKNWIDAIASKIRALGIKKNRFRPRPAPD
jgi:FMN-dependent NADH-azoreductase